MYALMSHVLNAGFWSDELWLAERQSAPQAANECVRNFHVPFSERINERKFR